MLRHLLNRLRSRLPWLLPTKAERDLLRAHRLHLLPPTAPLLRTSRAMPMDDSPSLPLTAQPWLPAPMPLELDPPPIVTVPMLEQALEQTSHEATHALHRRLSSGRPGTDGTPNGNATRLLRRRSS